MANANNNQSQFQWIVTCNHHDKSDCTLALGKPSNDTFALSKPMKFHMCPHTLLYYLPIWWIVMYGSVSCGKSSHYFIKRIASRPWLALSKFNLVSKS